MKRYSKGCEKRVSELLLLLIVLDLALFGLSGSSRYQDWQLNSYANPWHMLRIVVESCAGTISHP